MRVLMVEDEVISAKLLERALRQGGYDVLWVRDGVAALKALETQGPFDVLITDWMMPHMDGVELLRRVRERLQPLPLLVMVTAIDTLQAKEYVLNVVSADEYFTKPFQPQEVLDCLENGLGRLRQGSMATPPVKIPVLFEPSQLPPFGVMCWAASTGGPAAVRQVFKDMTPHPNLAHLLVIHGPKWMLETMTEMLQQETTMKVHLAKNGQPVAPGSVYLAPGDHHMEVISAQQGPLLRLRDGAPINFCRPSADPLFESAAKLFGPRALGVVLTGLGCDGARGAAFIHGGGGKVFVQDPEDAVAPFMPRAVVATGVPYKALSLEELGPGLNRAVQKLSLSLATK